MSDERRAYSEPPATAGRYEEATRRFIDFWGDMASLWGINRTMAQIHALLYSSEDPLDTDEIMARLAVSRGNANMNLRSLISWNLVRKVRKPGSRKDFYFAEKDVWEITGQIVRERERRELQPVMLQLQECRSVLVGERDRCAGLPETERLFCERLERLMELMELLGGLTAALTPLIHSRNAPMARQVLALVQQLSTESDSK